MALGGNSQFSSNLSKSLIQPDRFNRFSHLYRFQSQLFDNQDQQIQRSFNREQQQFSDVQLNQQEFDSIKVEKKSNITQGSNQGITANFLPTIQMSQERQETLISHQRVQSLPIEQKIAYRRKLNYSQLDKSMIRVQNNERLLQIRQKLRQARPLMNVQFTNHVLSRAPFTTMDQLNTLGNELIQQEQQDYGQRVQDQAGSLKKFANKKWLLYDKKPHKLARKSFYMNALDKSSNFILPKIVPPKNSDSITKSNHSQKGQKVSKNYHHNFDQQSQLIGVRKIRANLSGEEFRRAPQNSLKQRKMSKVQSLRSGLEAGYFRPVRLNPSIQSPMPQSLLTSNQRESLLSLNLHGVGSLINTRQVSIIGSDYENVIPDQTGGGKLNSVDTNPSLPSQKKKTLNLQIITPTLPQSFNDEQLNKNLRSPLHINPMAGRQTVDPQIAQIMKRL